MRASRLAAIGVLLLTPAALAGGAPEFVLLSAKMDVIFDLVEPAQENPVASHHRFTFTVQNVGGAPAEGLVAIDPWWYVTDLPYTIWHEWPVLNAGEARTWVVDLDDGFWLAPGPMWFCLRASFYSYPGDRCWSALVGFTHPDGVYPEDVPNWQLLGTPMGDTP